mmetsp:Transcript_15571/g.29369  ORF Transcript_15571/g.29369 Transcript_15571/m.29369 type:complete len:608 (-) Transcript_15571:649-2472(-)
MVPISSQKENKHTPACRELEPQSGISCASASIRIKYGNHSMGTPEVLKPVYTHQIFEQEVIRGYQPFQSDILEAQELSIKQRASKRNSDCHGLDAQAAPPQQHASFRHPFAVFASQRIRITIVIAPSCKTCSIHINTMPIPDMRGVEKETILVGQKRKKSDEIEECPAENSLTGVRSFANETSTNVTPMDQKEILKSLSKAVPKVISITSSTSAPDSLDVSTFVSTNLIHPGDYLDSPIGTIISTYTRDRSASDDFLLKGNERSFPLVEYVLTLADGKAPGINEYHRHVQKLALFYIENADEVDLTSDQGGGHWKVLYLFARHHKTDIHVKGKSGKEEPILDESNSSIDHVTSEKVSVYSLVGYMTLFTFYSPFKKPKSGNVLRICQALILPPFQRQGHGKAMMSCVYEYARGKIDKGDNSESCIHDDIVEVNVEDPAPGFTYMRDSMDYCLFEQLFVVDKERRTEEIQEILNQYLPNDEKVLSWKPLTDHHATILAAEAKITKVQIQIAYEIYKLARMNIMIREEEMKWKKGDQSDTGSIEDKRSSLFREYRLMVKKRLNHAYKEEIGAYGSSKAEKQAKLSEIFEDTYHKYYTILGIQQSLSVSS